MTPFRATESYEWPALLRLIQTEFRYMEGRIDPPSSMHRLTEANIAAQAASGEIWVIEDDQRPVACIFLTPKHGALYLGKLAVAQSHRRHGLARCLIATAEARARALNLTVLELETRVELVENQATFANLGFAKTGETAHEGFDRPTSVTMRKSVERPR